MPLTNVGSLVAELGMDNSGFNKAMDQAGSRINTQTKGWEQRMRVVGDRLGAIGKTMSLRLTAPILGLAAGGLLLANRLGQSANELLGLRAAFGVSLEFLQGLKGAAIEAGVPWESVANVFERIAEQLREVSSQDEIPEIFRQLGIAVFDAEGAMRPLPDIFLDLVEALSQIENPLERARLGVALFPEEWARIAPLFDLGREKLEEVIDTTDKVPDSAIEAADEWRRQWESMKLRVEQMLFVMMGQLMPFMENTLVPFMQETLIPLLEKLITIVARLTERFIQLPGGVQLAIVGFVGLVAVVGPMLMVLSFLASFMSGLTLIIAGLAAGILLLWFAWDDVTSSIEERMGAWSPLIIELLQALFGPIGNLVLAVRDLKDNWQKEWNQVKDFVDTFTKAIDSMMLWLQGRIETIVGAIDGFMLNLVNRIEGFVNRIKRLVSQALSAIRSLPGNFSVPGFAEGVRNFAGGLAVVGERGPELVNLPPGSDVMPMSGRAALAGIEGGGNGQIVVTGNNIYGYDDFARQVGRAGGQVIRGGGWNKLRRR